jgi:SHS2 domain-containing protein
MIYLLQTINEIRFLEHTADTKFRAYGKNLNEVFENAALAFSETNN